MKKILAIAIVAIMMLQASVIFAAEFQAYKFKPELDGVISEGEYPAESTFVCDYETVLAQGVFLNAYSAETMPKDEKYEVSYAWDDENLYMAIMAVDKSPVPAKCWDITGGNFPGTGRSDGFQLNTFVDQEFGKWFMIGVAEDGTVYTCGIYNEFSDVSEKQNYTPYVVGKGSYIENGVVAELAIPWSMIEQGNHFADHNDSELAWVDDHYIIPWMAAGVEVEEGMKMAFTIAYQNILPDGDRGRYTNDVFHNNGETNDIRDYVVLAGEKPADTGAADDDQGTTDDDQGTTDTGADTGADTGDDAAQTFDFGVIALVAAVVSAAAVIIKKRR